MGKGKKKKETMEETFVPFEGIKNDLRGRLMCYKQDWTSGIKAGLRYILKLFTIVFLLVLYNFGFNLYVLTM